MDQLEEEGGELSGGGHKEKREPRGKKDAEKWTSLGYCPELQRRPRNTIPAGGFRQTCTMGARAQPHFQGLPGQELS